MKLSFLVPHNPPRYALRWRQIATYNHNIPILYINHITLSISGGPGNIRNWILNGFDSNRYVDVHAVHGYIYSYDIAMIYSCMF